MLWDKVKAGHYTAKTPDGKFKGDFVRKSKGWEIRIVGHEKGVSNVLFEVGELLRAQQRYRAKKVKQRARLQAIMDAPANQKPASRRAKAA